MAGTSLSSSGSTSVTLTVTPRTNLGTGVEIAVTDAAAVSLTPPVGANVAEITILDSTQAIIMRTDGVDPTNAPILGHTVQYNIELESVDEIAGFRAIAFVGDAVRLYVEYKNDPNASNN